MKTIKTVLRIQYTYCCIMKLLCLSFSLHRSEAVQTPRSLHTTAEGNFSSFSCLQQNVVYFSLYRVSPRASGEAGFIHSCSPSKADHITQFTQLLAYKDFLILHPGIWKCFQISKCLEQAPFIQLGTGELSCEKTVRFSPYYCSLSSSIYHHVFNFISKLQS